MDLDALAASKSSTLARIREERHGRPIMRTSLNDGGRLIRSRCRLLFLLLLVAAIAAPLLGSDQRGHPGGGVPEAPLPTLAQISQAIALSAGYLERACGPDGKFVYEIDINTGKKSNSYNIVRHAGAIYALAMLNHSQPEPQAVDAMVRAAVFMRQNYIGPGVRPSQLAVWSEPLAQQSKSQHHDAELGATGLGLVALAEVRRAEPKAVPLEDLQSLGRFLLFLQKDDGSFVNKYRAESGPVQDWESLYYPGEAALAFVSMYETDHSREWLIATGKALSFLARSRAALSTAPADHWALIATAKLLPYCDHSSCPGGLREELIQHAIQVCNSILREQFRGSAAVGIAGAFDPEGRTAPAATRLEGLLAALEFLPKDELRAKIKAATGRGIAFLLRMQIGSGPYSGGMPGAFATRALDSSEVRIDYVQHALCAWLLYEQLFQPTEAAPRPSSTHSSHIRILFGGGSDFGATWSEPHGGCLRLFSLTVTNQLAPSHSSGIRTVRGEAQPCVVSFWL